VRTYFSHVFPFSPVISRASFERDYRTARCSLLLLRSMLVPAAVHVPMDVLEALGFTSRAAAQNSLFEKASALYDFSAHEQPSVKVQACFILGAVFLDKETDRDFGYWFHNAVGLADKIGVRDKYIHSVDFDTRRGMTDWVDQVPPSESASRIFATVQKNMVGALCTISISPAVQPSLLHAADGNSSLSTYSMSPSTQCGTALFPTTLQSPQGQKMTGIPKTSKQTVWACSRRSRLCKRPCLCCSVNCPERVGVQFHLCCLPHALSAHS
jgi:hypothetical protein